MSTRTLQLPGQALTYQLKRSARRSIGLKISRDGLTVTLPLRLSIVEAERAVRQKLDWILDKLAAQAERPAPPAALACGSQLLWLGEPITLRTGSTRSRRQGVELHLACADHPEQITAKLVHFYQRSARAHFSERVRHWGETMGLTPRRLALSSARGRWGSCSSSGGLRLNWRLMQSPPDVIDYVVIHELAHLAELNHSPRFWAIVETHCPDWKTRRDWLKRNSVLLMDW